MATISFTTSTVINEEALKRLEEIINQPSKKITVTKKTSITKEKLYKLIREAKK